MEILWKPYENACGFHSFFIGIALVVTDLAEFDQNTNPQYRWERTWRNYGSPRRILPILLYGSLGTEQR